MQEYLPALWIHWVALMSGTISLFIAVGLRIGRRFSRVAKGWSDIPDWIFISVGIVCLFWAGYGAWQDKNTALLDLQDKLKTPKFDGALGFVGTALSGQGDTLLLVGGIITNPQGPESGIFGWTVEIECTDGTIVKGEIPFSPGKDEMAPLVGQPGQTLVLSVKNYWPAKSANPIPAGGSSTGWIKASFGNLNLHDELSKGASVVITFKDIRTSHRHQLRERLPTKGEMNLPSLNRTK
jgi:hypothetical protein